MDIKLIATDLDGTLLQDDSCSISHEDKNALEYASKKGIKIVIASGRTYSVMEKIMDEIKTVDYLIMSNGTSVYDLQNNKYIFKTEISENTWRKVFNLLLEQGSVFEMYHQGKTYIPETMYDKFDSPHVSRACVTELKSHLIKISDSFSELEGGAEKFNVLYTPEANIEKLREKLDKVQEIDITSSIPGNIEINKKGINKGEALKMLCSNINISPEEVISFGDNDNDIPMLEAAGVSFAVENATNGAKKAAKFITKPNVSNGVSCGIHKILNGIELNID